MKKLFESLAFRLSMGIAAILLLAFLGLILVYQQSIRFEFREFLSLEESVSPDPEFDLEEQARNLENLYRQGGWERVIEGLGERPVLLINKEGTIMAGEPAQGARAEFSRNSEGRYEVSVRRQGQGDDQILLKGIPGTPLVTEDGELFGHLLVLRNRVLEQPSEGFATSVFKNATWLLLSITFLTVLLVGASVRLGLDPVHRITEAARLLKKGTIPKPVRVKARGEVGDLVSVFNDAVEELARTENMRKKFITAVAHELRTPVTNLKGQLEALEAGLIKKDRDFIATLKGETSHLEGLVGDLQDLALSDAGRLKIYPEPVTLLEEIRATWKAFYGAGKSRLNLRVSKKLEIHADPRRLRQIFQNLFSNALNARPEGLVLTVMAKARKEGIEITLCDNGPGIPPGDLPHIFTRFYRADLSRTRDTGGTGLGLAIVRTLIEAHGGTIRAENRAPKGACFILSLPRKISSSAS